MNEIKKNKHFLWIITIAWMILIFWFSSKSSFTIVSYLKAGVLKVIQAIEDIVGEDNLSVSLTYFVVRKIIHFLLYTVLGYLAVNAVIKSKLKNSSILFLLFLCVAYLVFDEIRQDEVISRYASAFDVAIGFAGFCFGSFLYTIRKDLKDINIDLKMYAGWLPVVVWMCVIFWFSSQTGAESGELSERVTQIVLDFGSKIFSGHSFTFEQAHLFVRKCAHFFIYFVLGMLVLNALLKSGIKKSAVVIAIVICLAYAISDEIHQLYVDSRAGSSRDVLIDFSGLLLGSVLYRMLFFNKKKIAKE